MPATIPCCGPAIVLYVEALLEQGIRRSEHDLACSDHSVQGGWTYKSPALPLS